jgi:pycsar effector protein
MNLRLDFVVSAYDTAQSMIRFSDQKASMVFVFHGILLALLGIRMGRLAEVIRTYELGILSTGGLLLLAAFLGCMAYSLMYALRTLTPTFAEAAVSPEHRRLYWYQDVRRRDVREYLRTVQGLSDDQVLQEMVYELYSVQAIEKLKFERIRRATGSAAAALLLWQAAMVLTIFL